MAYHPLTKTGSSIELLRKPVSFVVAGLLLLAALFTVPRGHGNGWHEVLELTGFLFLIIAALGRIWATAYVAGRKTRELCRLGPYSLTRNPLYFFSFIGAVGFGFAIQNLILGVIIALLFLAYYAAVIRSEERRLRAVHGEKFDEYCAQVPRFWPRLARPEGGQEVVLNVAPFTRGLREVFWFLAAIIGADVLEWVLASAWWPTFTLPF
jgi:protein-S-isoprenylcysteine O-methyltransferase Ste14